MKLLRLAAIMAALIVAPSSIVVAQTGSSKTATQLNTEVNSLWIDNTTGGITPFNARQTLLDLIASASNLQGTNIFSSLQTFNAGIAGTLPSGLGQAFNFTQSPSGSSAANTNFNSITLSDTATITGGFFGNGLTITDNFGGSSVQGGRQVIISTAALNAATSASNTNRNYVGVQGVGQAIANDNGTNPASLGTSAGAMFGGSFIGVLGSSATAFLNVTGAEFNTRMVTGSSAAVKTLAQFSSDVLDRVQGSVIDSMLWLSNQSGSNPGWNNAILIDGANGIWPIKSTGTIIQTIGAGTAANGIDFSNTTFSATSFKSNGFQVAPTGGISSGFAGVGSGSLTLNGGTSGSVILNTPATGGVLNVNGTIASGLNGGTSGSLTLNGSSSGSTSMSVAANGVLTINSQSGAYAVGGPGIGSGSIVLNGVTSGAVQLGTPAASGGLLAFQSAGSFSANGAVATVLGSVGPTGSHTTVQTWLTIVDSGGVTRFIPAF